MLVEEELKSNISLSPNCFMRASISFAASQAGFRRRARAGSASAFTLIELMAVIGVMAILAALLFPMATKSKGTAQTTACENNFKQLQLAWLVYTVDFHDSLPGNKWMQVDWQDGCPTGHQTTSDAWVLGEANVDTSSWNIQNGCLFPYSSRVDLYHCPTDGSAVDLQPKIPRQRSYSMSYYMNGSEGKPERKTKLTQIAATSRAFVFIEEHEDSINDGVFFAHVVGDEGEQAEAQADAAYRGAHWMDWPANRHGQGCNLSFADGHAEHWRWRWPKQVNPVNPYPVNQLDFQDLRRIQACIPSR